MKMTAVSRQRPNGESIDLDALIERGRQLHSKAVFEMCAKIFYQNKILKTTLEAQNKEVRLADSR